MAKNEKSEKSEKGATRETAAEPHRVVGLRYRLTGPRAVVVAGIGEVDPSTGLVNGFAEWRQTCRVERPGKYGNILVHGRNIGGFERVVAQFPYQDTRSDDDLIDAAIRCSCGGRLEPVEKGG
jgi:hypothetical protein